MVFSSVLKIRGLIEVEFVVAFTVTFTFNSCAERFCKINKNINKNFMFYSSNVSKYIIILSIELK